ncbi:hypothetical protein ACHQM5_005165 [Ranunculus cassubicifolius]
MEYIYGSGMIQQKITQSAYYYVALGNLNSEEVKAKLNFSIGATLYNTFHLYCWCSIASFTISDIIMNYVLRLECCISCCSD